MKHEIYTCLWIVIGFFFLFYKIQDHLGEKKLKKEKAKQRWKGGEKNLSYGDHNITNEIDWNDCSPLIRNNKKWWKIYVSLRFWVTTNNGALGPAVGQRKLKNIFEIYFFVGFYTDKRHFFFSFPFFSLFSLKN